MTLPCSKHAAALYVSKHAVLYVRVNSKHVVLHVRGLCAFQAKEWEGRQVSVISVLAEHPARSLPSSSTLPGLGSFLLAAGSKPPTRSTAPSGSRTQAAGHLQHIQSLQRQRTDKTLLYPLSTKT